ncbi:MAG TPA: serine hydrolase [Candidatus Methanoperedens sp.]|nr:serine hydrolase [Candidatus Methanoperedens sp.]
MKRSVTLMLVGAGLAAAFAAGFAAGRRGGAGESHPPAEDYEIRGGGHGYTNPLLECEIAGERHYRVLRPFGARLGALVADLRKAGRAVAIAVYFRDLNNGPWVGYQEQERFVPASLAKMPVVLASFLRAEAVPGFLEQRIVHKGLAEEQDPGFVSPEANLERGKSYSVDELIQRVARYSDNTAARLLAGALPPGLLEQVYADLGIDPARMASPEPTLSPREYASFFRVLYNASYLNLPHSEQALRYFDQSTFELGLVAGVPEGTPVSHKFGVWEGESAGSASPLQLHDCGIVYHPRRPYLLCVMTAGKNYVEMSAAIADVSRFVWGEIERNITRAGGPQDIGGLSNCPTTSRALSFLAGTVSFGQ